MKDGVPPPAPRPRSGFFAKVKRGLFMTHTEILEKIEEAVKEKLGFDESVLETLEEALVAADVGTPTAAALVAGVASRAKRYRPEDLPKLKVLLREEIDALLAWARREHAGSGSRHIVLNCRMSCTAKKKNAMMC